MALINTQFTRDPIHYLTNTAIAIDTTFMTNGLQNYVLEDHGYGLVPILRPKTQNDASGFPVYFLQYMTNSTFQLKLGRDAKIMITPPLTGCSFFIQNKWWNPTVSHINRQDHMGATNQWAIDQDAQFNVYGKAQQVNQGTRIVVNYYSLRKDDYVPMGQNAQNHRTYIVGIRRRLTWIIYKMKHDVGAGQVTEAPTRIN